ncbi:MAG: O-antigen ligase family protein [Bacteroidales bacterium]|nr:O-antigen ligase family protein [Bacteroidales bacterium]MBN2817820.1 O-antigen ligase family protein [Bacteroidales bacterium]
MFNSQIHRYIYIFATVLILVAFPFSPFLLSLGQFILAGNWLLESEFKRKWQKFKENKGIFLFISFYLIHVIWLFNTKNFEYAFHDLKIKLPIFSLPLIYGTSVPLKKSELKLVLHLFIASAILATLWSIVIYFGLTSIQASDNRKLSPFISHIRFSLLLVLTVYIIVSFLIYNKPLKYFHSYYYLGLLAWLIFFLLFFSALTGAFILLFITPFALIFWLRSKENRKYSVWTLSALVSIMVLFSIYTTLAYTRYSNREIIDLNKLETHTVNGNKYFHYPENIDYENSQRVWIYVCEKELRDEWNKKSEIEYYGKDKKGQFIRTTLVRYLTSLGYRKDSVGISNLTTEDIRLIESGITNYINKNKLSLYPRIYQLFWEIDSYKRYGNPSGHSFTQRIEYVKNACRVIQRHFWLGTGTGDVNDEIKLQYKLDHSILAAKWQLRAHNQYITLFLSFGLVGFTLIVVIFILLLRNIRNNIDFISFVLFLIVFLSMLNEDTLETQAGANFFAFFFSLLIFARKIPKQSNET